VSPANSTFRLLHLTDTHLHANADAWMRGVNTFETFTAVVERAMADPLPPDAILATGDLVQDESRAGYERFREALTPYGIPVYCVPGNHDSPERMTATLDVAPFKVGGTATHKEWAIVLLNTHSAGEDDGHLTTTDLSMLENALHEHRAQHVLIGMHHHPVPMGSRWLDGVALRNADDFLDIVDKHPHVRGIIWGHVHQASDRRRNDVRLISSPSTCAQFLPNSDDFAIDNRTPGFRWLNLRGSGAIDTQVCWLE
jgi:Icc protein